MADSSLSTSGSAGAAIREYARYLEDKKAQPSNLTRAAGTVGRRSSPLAVLLEAITKGKK